MEVNERVFKMYLYLKENSFERNQVADLLDITSRQLTRLLNKWQDEGILSYTSGSGRGNASELHFNINVEQAFINHFLKNFHKYDIPALQEILNLDMSESARKVLRVCIDENLYSKEEEGYKRSYYIDYLYRIPERIHPLEKMDVALATILVNVGERLYEDEGNAISSQLVLFDEWQGNDFIIHLQRNTRFSNGDLLQSYDVQYCLEQLSVHKKLPAIQLIETPTPLKIVIHFEEKIEHIKLILSQDFATLYKLIDAQILFTGPYRIFSVDDTAVRLTMNDYYRQSRPDITDLIFTNDRDYYQDYTVKHDYHILDDQSYSSIDFILFNPQPSLSFEERQYIAQLINHPDIEKREMSRPIKMLKIKESNEWVTRFIETLQQSVAIDIIEVPFSTYIEEPLHTFGVDMTIMNERLVEARLGYYLLTEGKFSEWYSEEPESKQLLDIYTSKHEGYWPYFEKRFRQSLRENAWAKAIKGSTKQIYLPSTYKEIETTLGGIPSYASIKRVSEVNRHD
ncbi:hypothetical protein ERX27_05560 [Macrococcus brunensis]|uniref:Transcriptional regulator SgrR N-terminal HTH domain-containing protein n=1 Tax=Macrococcus brunensis TaxID=198483 RepID=A0A4R6BDR9_9STAP|nr:SgrR family transcriptional regulator [Macrococcus brunensis]TDL97927.1 hypothetical protein ERX27_05560 [Macrococcus brunensis]